MLSQKLLKELTKELSLKRLYHTGLFQRLPNNHADLTAEINLHRAVLDRALLDCFHIDVPTKKDVEKWLDLSNPDFITSCERADLEPRLVYELFIRVKEILKGQVSEIPENFL